MKPTTLWSPASSLGSFWGGRLKQAEVRAEAAVRNPDGRQPPCRGYANAAGRKRFQGTPELKKTGSGPKKLKLLFDKYVLIVDRWLSLQGSPESIYVAKEIYQAVRGQDCRGVGKPYRDLTKTGL